MTAKEEHAVPARLASGQGEASVGSPDQSESATAKREMGHVASATGGETEEALLGSARGGLAGGGTVRRPARRMATAAKGLMEGRRGLCTRCTARSGRRRDRQWSRQRPLWSPSASPNLPTACTGYSRWSRCAPERSLGRLQDRRLSTRRAPESCKLADLRLVLRYPVQQPHQGVRRSPPRRTHRSVVSPRTPSMAR